MIALYKWNLSGWTSIYSIRYYGYPLRVNFIDGRRVVFSENFTRQRHGFFSALTLKPAYT